MAKRTIKLSKEQRDAIAYRDGMAMVLAAAGSGKTWVIERRTLALVTERADHHGTGTECRINCLVLHDRDYMIEDRDV